MSLVMSDKDHGDKPDYPPSYIEYLKYEMVTRPDFWQQMADVQKFLNPLGIDKDEVPKL